MEVGHRELVTILKKKGVLKSEALISAFTEIDRADFVLPEYKDEAYEDHPLPIGHGATISQPSTVAFMLELLGVEKGMHILDVGAGSGYTTALLEHLKGDAKTKVYATEKVPELLRLAQKNLNKYSDHDIIVRQAEDDTVGLPQFGPYDRILVSAAADTLPTELVNQLKAGGIMVLPINNSIWKIEKKDNGEIAKKEFEGFVFVPLVK